MQPFHWVTAGEPFPGAAPPFGSKSEDDIEEESEVTEAKSMSWNTPANGDDDSMLHLMESPTEYNPPKKKDEPGCWRRRPV